MLVRAGPGLVEVHGACSVSCLFDALTYYLLRGGDEESGSLHDGCAVLFSLCSGKCSDGYV